VDGCRGHGKEPSASVTEQLAASQEELSSMELFSQTEDRRWDSQFDDSKYFPNVIYSYVFVNVTFIGHCSVQTVLRYMPWRGARSKSTERKISFFCCRYVGRSASLVFR
jgi:hypothetical protein